LSLAVSHHDITNTNNAPGEAEGVWEVFAAVHLRARPLGWALTPN